MSIRAALLSCLFLCLGTFASGASAGGPIGLEARLAQPAMKSGGPQKNYLRIALQGCKPEPSQTRTPVNVAFVIDRSGSMNGDRIAQAREAAIVAINRLNKDDIASVIIFDDYAEVLMQAQPVHDPAVFANAIRRIGTRGSTAIHAGVLLGANEVRRYQDPKRLNRVVLLSDGQANVGPSKPADFTLLGQALLSEGISVSTIGLGLSYNEDLMLALARAGDGNHAFARAPDDLIQIFNKEFDDVLASCAQTVSIDVDLAPGVRLVRALSRDATIEGNRAKFLLNQVYAATEHYVLMEIEVGQDVAPGEQELGVVKVAYTLPSTGARQTLDTQVKARLGATQEEATATTDNKVVESVIQQVAKNRTQEAIVLRDMGKFEEAQKLFLQNAAEIDAFVKAVPGASAQLQEMGKINSSLGLVAKPVSPSELGKERKYLRALEAPSGATRY